MGDKWNLMSLKAPPVYHVRTDTINIETLTKMKNIIGDLVDALSKQAILNNERLCLQRILYKLKNQMCHQKHFAFLRLISKCLRCYMSLNLQTLMTSLLDEFQSLVEQYEEQLYVPSMQTLQYHMVKLQCAAGILAKMAVYCIQAYFPVKQVMAIGHFLTKNIMFLAILGRLWALSKFLIFGITKGFNQIFPHLSSFPASQVPWLSEDEELPQDLSVWIRTTWPELDINFKGITDDPDGKEIESADKRASSSAQWDFLKSASLFGGDCDIGVPVSTDEEEMDESANCAPFELGLSSSTSPACPQLSQDEHSGVTVSESQKTMQVKRKRQSSENINSPSVQKESYTAMIFGGDKDIGVPYNEMSSNLETKTNVNTVRLDFNSVHFLKTVREAKRSEEFEVACAALRHRGKVWKGNKVWLKEELNKIERIIQMLKQGRPRKKKIAQCQNRISKVFNTMTEGSDEGNHFTSPKMKLLLPIMQEYMSSVYSVRRATLSLTQNEQIELGPFYTLQVPKAVALAILQNFKQSKKKSDYQEYQLEELFLSAIKSVLLKVSYKKTKALWGKIGQKVKTKKRPGTEREQPKKKKRKKQIHLLKLQQ